MTDTTLRLLTAERQARALTQRLRPCPGDTWTITAGQDSDACAMQALARWAGRFGARVQLVAGAKSAASVLREGQVISVPPLPDDAATWGIPLADSWLLAGPVSPASPRMTAAQCRTVDKTAITQLGVPGICLMENAAAAAVAAAAALPGWRPGAKVLIAAGGGNNGGDGLAAARGLYALGAKPTVVLCKPRASLSGDAAINLRLLSTLPEIPVYDCADDTAALERLLADADLVVDGLLGTGFTGRLSAVFAKAIACINERGLPVLGLDLPSGLNADTGVVADNAVRCTSTITFAAVKHGLERGDGPAYCGTLLLGDIGAPAAALVV